MLAPLPNDKLDPPKDGEVEIRLEPENVLPKDGDDPLIIVCVFLIRCQKNERT